MDISMVDTKNVILALKRVKKERKLSLDKILIMMDANDPSSTVSKTTLSRVFAKGSEDQIFKYENTLRPIANVLLDMEHIEQDDDNDTKAMKSILKLKKDIIDELEEKLKDHKRLEEQVAHYQQALELLNSQIALKDKRIDQLMDANDRLTDTNNRLIIQFLDCPLKNVDGCS